MLYTFSLFKIPSWWLSGKAVPMWSVLRTSILFWVLNLGPSCKGVSVPKSDGFCKGPVSRHNQEANRADCVSHMDPY